MTTFTSVDNLNKHILEHMKIANSVKTIYSLLKMVISINLGMNVAGEKKVENIFDFLQHIPVIWNKPTLEDFDRFTQVMQANADRPVFVHCVGNFRVSAFMYFYRRIYQNIDEEKAQKDLRKLWVSDDA